MIEVLNLTKKYGDKLAVDDVSFQIQKGEIIGFLGPNGAGKTTVMNIITGYISASEGNVKVSGYDVLEDPIEVKKRIGYLPEHPPLYLDMTVYEYLSFAYDLKKIKLDKQEHIAKVMYLVKISNVKNRLIKNLSKGYKQRVGMAQALLGNPEFLILDEPTVGLDPKQITEIRDVILNLGKTHTIMISTHILQEVTAVCDRVIIISNGKIVASDTVKNLTNRISGGSALLARIVGNEEEVLEALHTIDGIEKISVQPTTEPDSLDYTIEVNEGNDIRQAIFYKLAEIKKPLIQFQNLSYSLEDIFLKVTKETVVTSTKRKNRTVHVKEGENK